MEKVQAVFILFCMFFLPLFFCHSVFDEEGGRKKFEWDEQCKSTWLASFILFVCFLFCACLLCLLALSIWFVCLLFYACLFVALNFAGAKVRNSAWTVSPTLLGCQKLNSDASTVKERNAKKLNRPSETSE